MHPITKKMRLSSIYKKNRVVFHLHGALRAGDNKRTNAYYCEEREGMIELIQRLQEYGEKDKCLKLFHHRTNTQQRCQYTFNI